MKKQIKETIKSGLNAVGIGAYLFPKTPTSSLDKLEYLKTTVNDKPLDIIVRANGSDKHVYNQIFIIEEYKGDCNKKSNSSGFVKLNGKLKYSQ